MKKVIVILLFIARCTWLCGQTDDLPIPESELLDVKDVLENQLAGTPIRDLEETFRIELDSTMGQYVFTSNITALLPPDKALSLHTALNKLLPGKKTAKFSGAVYFDPHLDSVLVTIKEFRENEHFFNAAVMMPEPAGGMEAFSRKIHDYLRIKMNQGSISARELTSKKSLSFIVHRGGLITRDKHDGIDRALDSLFAEESKSRRWGMGFFSGFVPTTRIDLWLFPGYITGESSWPEKTAWNAKHLVVPLEDKRNNTYYTEDRKSLANRYTVISLVYDAMLKKYRMPCLHSGSAEKCNSLIRDVIASSKSFVYHSGRFRRIYFYRE